MRKKKNTFVYSLLMVLCYLILSCENPMVKSILPDTDVGTGVRHKSSYTVGYNANGGNGEMEASVFGVGIRENLPPNTFTRENYVFTGWALSADGDVEYADKAAVKDLAAAGKTVTLYAKWGVNVYIVDYNANGGDGHMAPGIVALGQEFTLAANAFTREGYMFAGWSVSADGVVEYTDKAAVKDLATVGETVTLYAVWQGFTYTVEYNANGGNGEMDDSVFTYDEPQKLRLNAFILDGYVFAGWSTSPEGDVEYANEESVLNLSGIQGDTITLYAQWGINIFTVSYVANGGSGYMAPSIVTLGQEFTLVANTFTREGYMFAGWSVSADGVVEYTDKAAIQNLVGAGETVTLYAVWQNNTYLIEYNANGGYGEMDGSVFTYDEPQMLRPNAFILGGYVFAGWSTSPEGDVEYANKESVLNLTVIPGDTITLYAQWGTNIFTVSYIANGGSGHMAPGIVTLGQEFNLAANAFTREGYFFIGWSLLNDGEVHLEDEGVIQNTGDIIGETIRFYAVWLPDMAVIWPVEMYAAYGQTLSDIRLPGGGYSKIPGTFTWAAPGDPVGNAGIHPHRMVFTPEDTVHYDVVMQDVEIIVYPRLVNIIGTLGRALIPFDSADTLYGKTSTLAITLDGLLNGDTVTLAISEGYGLSLSDNIGIGNNTQRTVNVSYDGTTTINESGPVILELYINDNDNYMLYDAPDFELTILDGQAESRAIPVTQANIAEFNSYANTENGLARHYKLAQNITSSGYWEPIGTITGQFTGSFDGNGFTISNLAINRTAAYQGIFGYVGIGGVVKNVGKVNGNIIGGNYTGGIAGYNSGTIQNCYMAGRVHGDTYIGGVAGFNNGTLQNCYGISDVSGGSNVGGLAGQNNGTIQNCYVTSSVSSSSGNTGGIVGVNNSGKVQNCVALNLSVTTSGSSGTIGRVSGTGSGSNNYAHNEMVLKYNWNGRNGTNKTVNAGLTTVDGASITTVQWDSSSWWQATANWNTTSGTSVWNFMDIWEMNVNNLPKLRTAGGSQNHELMMGDGTEANPYRVYNEATLKKIGIGYWALDKHYLQIQDIILPLAGQSNWTAIGRASSNGFSGSYDGGGYTIFNLTINSTTNEQGMFRYIGTSGKVKNLGLIGGGIRGSGSIGGVVGYNDGTVQNCYTTGSVSGSGYPVGGIAGRNNGTIQNCYSTGNVSGGNLTSGVVGYNDNGTIQNCYSTGNVSGGNYTGGVTGDNNNGTIQNCYSTGNVSGSGYTGGVTGRNSRTVQNCYATGNVSGGDYIGGVMGRNYGKVLNCYATGSVSGKNYIGGVTGGNDGTTLQNCSALNSVITTSDGDLIGRIAGRSPISVMSNNYARVDMTVRYNWNGSTGATKIINAGLTTVDGANIGAAQYNVQSWWQNAANWAAGDTWDFTNIWEMNANNLPMLKNTGGIQAHLLAAGDGTENNPFIVYDVDTLRKVGSGTDGWGLNKHYRQVQDITLSQPAAGQSNWTAIGTSSGQFTGSFDGNGFIISNLTINRTTTYQGIFGYIGTGGLIKNMGIINGNVSGGNYTGGIAGYNNGTIQNCYMTGRVSGGNYTGGIAGYNNGTSQNCYVTGNVNGNSNVGGVAGQNNGTVQNCYAAGSVSGSGNIGGVVGNGGTVRNCVALNPSVTTSGSSSAIGRVLGTGSGSNNHARSDIVVKNNWNGFNGANKTISTGLATVDGANITAAQWNNLSWWQTTANWNTASGASVWNFTNIWVMNANNIPRLRTAGGAQNHAPGSFVDFMEMVWIPAGNFTMGSPASEDNRFEDEGPQRTVTLTGFYMGKYTVTQEQYQAVMGTNPSGFTTAVAGENAARLPVEQITWYDAVEFCNKLSQLEGLTPVYTISGRTPATGYPITSATVTATLSRNGYRLPTEAQWEYACRAGTNTAYYTGASISSNTGWYNANSINTTHEVGKKPVNAWGLYDMHGNVWEWCGDWFGNYPSGAQTNPTGATSGLTRVTRGGSWYSSPQGVRSACRNADNPSNQFANLGFRVARP